MKPSAGEAARLQDIDKLALQADQAAAVTKLIEALKDGSPAVRAHAARSLGKIGPAAKPAAEALVALVADPDQHVRRQAIGAIRAIHPGPQVTLPLFIKLLEDSDPGIRMRVLGAVSEHGAEAVPALIEALKNDKAAYWTCLILRDIGPAAKDAVPGLSEKLKDPRAGNPPRSGAHLGGHGETRRLGSPANRRPAGRRTRAAPPRPMPWAASAAFPPTPRPRSRPTSRATTRCSARPAYGPWPACIRKTRISAGRPGSNWLPG